MDIFLISSGILAVAIVLNIIGSVLKYRTGTPNELIAVILTAVSFLIWCLIGAWNGVSLGLPTVALAVTGWDVFHGIHRFRKSRKERKE